MSGQILTPAPPPMPGELMVTVNGQPVPVTLGILLVLNDINAKLDELLNALVPTTPEEA